MRGITPITIAAAMLLAATPAAAQNAAGGPDNAVTADNSVVTTNDMTTTSPTDATVMPGSEAAALPLDANADAGDSGYAEPTADAAPEKRRGFPWGVVGLLGLVGLIPRMRRSR
jgi:hypothetical protein